MTAQQLPSSAESAQAASDSLDRRQLLRGAAAGGGALAVGGLLAACAGESAGGAGGGSGAGQATAGAAVGSVEAAQVPVGGGIVLPGENVVITQPEAGEYRAFSAICTHQGCPVSSVEARGIKCPCHSSFFDPSSGAVVAGPAPTALSTIPCRLEDGRVVYGG